MKQYEVTFIVDPVLSGDEIKATEKVYEEMLKNEGCNIIHVDEMGLKQLAYTINKRSSGIYYTIEFETESGIIINKLELALKRDERVMRFLTVALDKYGAKYNLDKRAGLIGKVKKKSKGKKEDEVTTTAAPMPKPGFSAEVPAAIVDEKIAPVVAAIDGEE